MQVARITVMAAGIAVISLAAIGCDDSDSTTNPDVNISAKAIAEAYGECNRTTGRTESNPTPEGFAQCLADRGVPQSRINVEPPMFRGDGDRDPSALNGDGVPPNPSS